MQSAWSLLVHCAGARANYLLRVIRPELVRTFAEGHNRGLWNCLNHILSIDSQVDETVQDIGSLPLSMGGLGLRSATRTSQPAFWASWADCPAMIRARHPDVAALILLRMQGPAPPTLAAAASTARCLSGVEGFEHHRGKLSPMVNVLQCGSQMILNLATNDTGGSTKRHRALNDNTGSIDSTLC